MKLKDAIKQDTFESPYEEVFLNLLVTHSWVMHELGRTMAQFGITPAQYNVLRILRGSHPEKLTCGAIRERLIDKTPDVTRLLDRLLKKGWVTRRRSRKDRRVVEVGITQQGLELLEQMDEPVQTFIRNITRHLDEEEARQLSQLLEKLRIDMQQGLAS